MKSKCCKIRVMITEDDLKNIDAFTDCECTGCHKACEIIMDWEDYRYLLREKIRMEKRIDKLEERLLPLNKTVSTMTTDDIINQNIGKFYSEVVEIISAYDRCTYSPEFSYSKMLHQILIDLKSLFSNFQIRNTKNENL